MRVRIASLVCFAILAGPITATETGIEPSQSFPDLRLPLAGGAPGELRSISSFRGQKLLLHVFASW
jgi:hypothetical protein